LISSRVTRRRRLPSYRKVAQRVDEALAIRIIHDDQFAPVTTIHDGRQHSRLSICRQYRESGFGRYTNIKN
jgi:pyridoxine/pyridoxamine 5'-phosphate oxidase